ncbi:MAG: hypothetical protein WAW39_16075 [Prosthecobacter sp.]|uniref:hypothetical protein n=1 Tax=Prosthecobacter sp. TaxID=1965333 RepID=UPI003BB0449D
MGNASTVDILLKTTGDTSGVDKINAALGITEKSEKQLAAARAQFLSATEREVAEVNRLTDASKRASAARDAEAKAAAEQAKAAKEVTQETKLNTDTMQRLAEAAQRTQRFFTPQAINPWATASAGALKEVTQETKLHTDAMQRLADAAQRTQKFFTPQAVNPWVTASAGARVNVNQLHEAQQKASGSAQNLGTQVLYASRGLQDFQAAGMLGIANNLEQIAMSMGLGAGVAGAATVLGVAVQTMGPHVLTWLKSLDSDAAKLGELKATLERAGAAIKGDYSSNIANASRISEAFTQHLKQERDALEANDRALDSNLRLLKQRADLQKSENQRKLESDIEDIKAQNLPKDQERAAIATRKREELDANKKLADDAASAAISTDADKLSAEAKNRDQLKAKKAALEKERADAVEYERLLEDQKKLLDKVAAAEAALNSVGTMEDPVAYAKAREKANKARADLDASKARSTQIKDNAPEGRVRGSNEIQKELDQVKPQAQAAEDQTAKDAEALNAKLKAEQLAREFREKEYRRALDKIAREQNGGVNDQGNLNTPPQGLPGPPVPLPPPAAPGSTLPAPPPGFGPAEMNPPRVPTNAPSPTYGPQPNAPETEAEPTDPVEFWEKAVKDAEAEGYKEVAENNRKRLEAVKAKRLREQQAQGNGSSPGMPDGGQADAPVPAAASAPQAAAPATPQNNQGEEKIAAANKKAEEAFMRLAALFEKSAAAMEKKVAMLEEKSRNQGVMA